MHQEAEGAAGSDQGRFSSLGTQGVKSEAHCSRVQEDLPLPSVSNNISRKAGCD